MMLSVYEIIKGDEHVVFEPEGILMAVTHYVGDWKRPQRILTLGIEQARKQYRDFVKDGWKCNDKFDISIYKDEVTYRFRTSDDIVKMELWRVFDYTGNVPRSMLERTINLTHKEAREEYNSLISKGFNRVKG